MNRYHSEEKNQLNNDPTRKPRAKEKDLRKCQKPVSPTPSSLPLASRQMAPMRGPKKRQGRGGAGVTEPPSASGTLPSPWLVPLCATLLPGSVSLCLLCFFWSPFSLFLYASSFSKMEGEKNTFIYLERKKKKNLFPSSRPLFLLRVPLGFWPFA